VRAGSTGLAPSAYEAATVNLHLEATTGGVDGGCGHTARIPIASRSYARHRD